MANGTGNNYSDQQSYTMGGADVTLFAQWTIGDSCGPGSGITPQFIEPTGSDACTTGTLNSSVPSDTTTLGAQAWNWSCGIINTCSAPKYGCRTTYDSNYDLPQYGPNNPDNNYGCALTCENGSTNYAGGCPVYNITFNSNGGTGTMSAQTIPQGVTANLTANTFTRTGYTFAGWATSAGGSVSYADQAPYTMGGADATLYAKWTAIPYNLTLTKNINVGGTVSFSPTGTSCDTNCTSIINTYGYNTDVTLTATRSGSYTFTGWEGACSGTSSTCTVDMTEARSVKANFSTGNITLASSTCTIPYGGTTCNAIVSWETANLIQNTPVAVTRNNPSVEISTNASGTNVINAVNSGTSTYYLYHNGIILDQESIVASNTYKVSFNANDGNGTMSAQEIVSGQTKNLNANTFTRTGYTFGGWATSAGGSVIYADQASYTMGGADVTLYAKWTPIPYNLTITKNPEEGGTVISNPVGISCGATCSQLFGYNTTVVLTATPTGGSSFIGWGSGCDSVSGNTCTLLITSNRSVAVNFMSGKLTPRSPSCSILAGGSSCDILMDWEIKNPVGLTTEITAVGMENIEVSNSTYPLIQYGTRTLSIPYGWREFYLYNNAVELA
jgi:uncharacterized repeat protein (TIGR02543 family)